MVVNGSESGCGEVNKGVPMVQFKDLDHKLNLFLKYGAYVRVRHTQLSTCLSRKPRRIF